MIKAVPASLSADLIRRAGPAGDGEWIRVAGSRTGDDLRLFVRTWAAGFVFFLAFLA